jgi:hypothetical protein
MAGESAELIERIRASYAKLAGFLRLPFSHDMTAIRQVQDVPLIARRSDKHPDEILEALDLPGDSRPRVLYALRSGIYDGIVERAAASLPDWIFLSTTANAANTLGNLRPLPLGTQLTFADVLGISDIVIGKLGYGIVSETVAHRGARLLWLRRSGFREDEILESQIGRYSACREFPFDDFRRAAWTSHLQATLEVAAPTESLPPDGAGQCAEIVRSWLER